MLCRRLGGRRLVFRHFQPQGCVALENASEDVRAGDGGGHSRRYSQYGRSCLRKDDAARPDHDEDPGAVVRACPPEALLGRLPGHDPEEDKVKAVRGTAAARQAES